MLFEPENNTPEIVNTVVNPKKILIVDTSYLIFRSYFAYPNLTYAGTPVGALFGFCKTILALIQEFTVDEIIFAVDLPKPTFRHKVYADYKAGRPEAPEDMKTQFPLIYDWCKQITQNFFSLEGFEADDMVFTKTIDYLFPEQKPLNGNKLHLEKLQNQQARPVEIFIFSADKDLYQTLIFPQVKFIKTDKFKYITYDQASFETEFGLNPIQWLDYKALVGDNSDNLKGISGVGPKTAIKLLQNVGSLHLLLETLGVSNGFAFRSYFAHLDSQDVKLKAFIEAKQNQTLVEKIKANLEILEKTYQLSSLEYVYNLNCFSGFDLTKGLPIFEKYGFKSLVKNVQNQGQNEINKKELESQESLF